MATPAEDSLAQAERHVREAEGHIVAQEARIAELARDGRETAPAESLLETMRKSLELARQHLDQEREEADRRWAARPGGTELDP